MIFERRATIRLMMISVGDKLAKSNLDAKVFGRRCQSPAGAQLRLKPRSCLLIISSRSLSPKQALLCPPEPMKDGSFADLLT